MKKLDEKFEQNDARGFHSLKTDFRYRLFVVLLMRSIDPGLYYEIKTEQ